MRASCHPQISAWYDRSLGTQDENIEDTRNVGLSEDADVEKEVRLMIIDRFGLLRGPREERHTWCARTRNGSPGFARTPYPHRFRCGTETFYAGITRRDLNPHGWPLRDSARTRDFSRSDIVPRPYGSAAVVVIVVLNCGYSYSSDRVIYPHRTRSTSCTSMFQTIGITSDCLDMRDSRESLTSSNNVYWDK